MANANTVVIEGRLGKDAEKRGNDAGPVTFSVCWDKRRKDKITGDWTGEPHWFDVVSWGYLRDKTLTLRKGDLVVVSGKLETSSYEKDGVKRTSVQVVADSVGVVPRTDATAAEESDW